MNHLKLSLRAADDPRTIKEEDGVPIFASVFALHNTTRKEREETLPITVKASHELLAPTLVTELKKGVSLRRGGRVGVLQEPRNEPGVLFDLGGQFHRHHPAKIHCGEKPDDLMNKSTSVTVSLDEDAYGVFQSASEIVSRAGIRVPTGQRDRPALSQIHYEACRRPSGQNPDDEEDDIIPSSSSPRNE